MAVTSTHATNRPLMNSQRHCILRRYFRLIALLLLMHEIELISHGQEKRLDVVTPKTRQEKVTSSSDSEPSDVLSNRTKHAKALHKEGKYAEAATEFRAIMSIQQKALGKEHPDTLRARMNLANCLIDSDKPSDAAAEFEALVVIQRRVLGPEHPDTLASRMGHANALYAQGKLSEAEAELSRPGAYPTACAWLRKLRNVGKQSESRELSGCQRQTCRG